MTKRLIQKRDDVGALPEAKCRLKAREPLSEGKRGGKRGIVFCDMNGTLVFHKERNGIREVKRGPGDSVLVFDPKAGTKYWAYDTSTKLYLSYVALSTVELWRRLAQEFFTVIVSGTRRSTIEARKRISASMHAAIIEGGAVILGRDGNEDAEWAELIKREKGHLDLVAAVLRERGWVLDCEGRVAMIRVSPLMNLHKSREEFCALSKMELPEELKMISNAGALDIIPRSADNGRAIRYLMQKKGYPVSASIGIGDDIKDLDMLRETWKGYVLGSGYPEVLDAAKENGWYVSAQPHFGGINEILLHILSQP